MATKIGRQSITNRPRPLISIRVVGDEQPTLVFAESSEDRLCSVEVFTLIGLGQSKHRSERCQPCIERRRPIGIHPEHGVVIAQMLPGILNGKHGLARAAKPVDDNCLVYCRRALTQFLAQVLQLRIASGKCGIRRKREVCETFPVKERASVRTRLEACRNLTCPINSRREHNYRDRGRY
jgi:hypothetical protein